MDEAVKLTRFARYALRRIRENGQRAEAWRKVFSLILRVLHSVLSGEIPLERRIEQRPRRIRTGWQT